MVNLLCLKVSLIQILLLVEIPAHQVIFKLGGATISWRSQKQHSVATSTLEAIYMAYTQAAKTTYLAGTSLN